MRYFNGRQENDKRYVIQHIQNIPLRELKESKSLRTHFQVIIETQIRRNQKVTKN